MISNKLNKNIFSNRQVSFLGAGNMGSALIEGALNSGIIKADKVKIYDIDRNRLLRISSKNKIKAASSNAEAVRGSDFIFLCVKPQQMKDLLSEIKGEISPQQCFISIAAGVRTKTIESCFSSPVAVVRVMPNTPALVRSGLTAITKGKFAVAKHLQFASSFFSSVGKVVVLPEKYFDAVTAISGSGPAYLFYLAESLEEVGKKFGLSKSVVSLLVKQTLAGAGKMLSNSSSPLELRQKVTSPGGTTESAIRYMQGKRWSEIFVQAVQKAKDRSKELSLLFS